jgi:hypothetical protein
MLRGRLHTRGVEVRDDNGGPPGASLTIELTEVSHPGQECTTDIDCQAWGKKAEAAREVAPGALVLFEGRLQRVKQGERWATVVTGFALTTVAAGTAAHACTWHGV